MTADTKTQAIQPQLVSIDRSDVQTDGQGNSYELLLGVDRTGGIWTSIGVVTGQGFLLNPWIQQPRPTIVPQLPEEAAAADQPQGD